MLFLFSNVNEDYAIKNLVHREFSCNLTASDTPLRVDVGSDDCVSAGLVDEWLQARNALSIEIFFRTPGSGVHPVFCV